MNRRLITTCVVQFYTTYEYTNQTINSLFIRTSSVCFCMYIKFRIKNNHPPPPNIKSFCILQMIQRLNFILKIYTFLTKTSSIINVGFIFSAEIQIGIAHPFTFYICGTLDVIYNSITIQMCPSVFLCQCLKWGQSLAGPNNFFWASKKLVTGPNGIMVAQKFCDIFFMKKRHQISIYKQFSG